MRDLLHRVNRARALRATGAVALGLAMVLLVTTYGSPGAAAQTTPTTSPGAGSSGGGAQAFTVYMISANQFVPASLNVPRGATVTWQNISQVDQTSTDDPTLASNPADAALPDGAQPWDSGIIGPGQSFSYTFDISGTYRYFSKDREAGGMVGTITVLD